MRHPRTRRALLVLTAALATLAPALLPLGPAPSAVAAPWPYGDDGCPASSVPVARTDAARRVMDTVRRARAELGLRAVLVRVERRGREVVTGGVGESLAGVPAVPRMRVRAGAAAAAHLGTVLLQLVDEGRVRLDDPVSRWLPELPHGSRITLRMLGSSTSGLRDYATDPDFLGALYTDPFRGWTPAELLRIATARPLWYAPGTNWSYSHANPLVLGTALERITGTRLDALLERRVIRPLGLRHTRNSFTSQMPRPALHAFDSQRGRYEESTHWDPSWTAPPGAVLTTHVCDLARAARAVATGELLSAAAHRQRLDPGTVGLGGATARCPASVCRRNTGPRHYGLGVVVENGWVLQNPSFNGYAVVQAHLPSEGLTFALAATQGPTTPAGNAAEAVAARLARALTPGHPLTTL
ncbi:serine hydrolase domain-containing protein [Streptomyces sp. NPDC057638]|uniref:serine hydrolase domain-containing protein n=1 Tax=Streptomyces sp. NPDC057638 TaxID=3346190 RepID=UPI003687E4CA